MTKKDINTRADIFLLVSTFYDKVRADKTIGYFFNDTIDDWETHLDRLTSFWETSLFMTRRLEKKYYGNPLDAHVKVDKKFKHSIENLHFGVWLNLWFQTIDELFVGDIAENAKRRARKMGTFMYMKIYEARQNK
ncbi:group III truncated hemoglobin [Lacinutrix iliipiscaria]|uniref:Group III truncated hemoglobin n=1 Tax=Lacinutrix iliipiscaria TaxID=1230532 RepID=A0ABW5WMD8_9FLAO